MRNFSLLIERLDETTKSQEKTAALVEYFSSASSADAAYAVYFLVGKKLQPTLPTRILRRAAARSANIPDWLFEETYQWVGDLAETAATVAQGQSTPDEMSLAQWIELRLTPMLRLPDSEQIDALVELWKHSGPFDRFVVNKLLTGNLRVGVSTKLVTKALAQRLSIPAEQMQHRMMGNWLPTEQWFDQLIASENQTDRSSIPYPFCLAHSLPQPSDSLGPSEQFAAEWKWDGIRAQILRRNNQTFIWSRGEELLSGRFPEIETASAQLPNGTVLDGEILAWKDHRPLPFALLQRRIQRKKPNAAILNEIPLAFLGFDILEFQGQDIRQLPYAQRLERLNQLALAPPLQQVRTERFKQWEDVARMREGARERGAEGIMLKNVDGHYEAGRVTGTWWKWKLDPYSVDAVLVYAQRGHGRRAGLFSDYTFALWDQDRLVPFAKAYSGLSNAELQSVDRFIRENTLKKFGPVSEVRPELVMEIAFENIQQSTRHKSGLAVRFPRILRIRTDKTARDADNINALKARLISDNEPKVNNEPKVS
jgi:DNA ligase-1